MGNVPLAVAMPCTWSTRTVAPSVSPCGEQVLMCLGLDPLMAQIAVPTGSKRNQACEGMTSTISASFWLAAVLPATPEMATWSLTAMSVEMWVEIQMGDTPLPDVLMTGNLGRMPK